MRALLKLSSSQSVPVLYAEQRLACVNADGAARLVLSFKNHIRRRGGTVARTARDLRLPQVPEAPVQGQSGISGILAVSDLQSHHRAGGNHPRSFWDPLLHIKLGFQATTLLKRGTLSRKPLKNERFENLRITQKRSNI